MKKILCFVLCFGLFAAASCIDNREDGYTPSKVYLVKSGMQTYAATADRTTARASAWATKSGLLSSSCVVSYRVDPQYLSDYNAANGTSYEMLPESCYALERTEFPLKGGDAEARFAVDYNPAEICRLSRHGPIRASDPNRCDRSRSGGEPGPGADDFRHFGSEPVSGRPREGRSGFSAAVS